MSPASEGCIEILHPGIGVTVQDRGRVGLRHEGIPNSGWLDAPLAQAANGLLGNTADAAMFELRGTGLELRIKRGPLRLAMAGRISAKWLRQDGSTVRWQAWQSGTFQTGDRLSLGVAESGCAYLAVAGGLRLPPQLNSRSSYGRAGLQGLLGRPWRPGDLLPCQRWESRDAREWRSAEWSSPAESIRVLPGPQQDHFLPGTLAVLCEQTWQATTEQDRMGLRLQGTPLVHAHAQAADIVSDAVAPGAIQVPANGMPIILMADSQTVGGYPKIAHVITADLPRLAHLKPGTPVRFQLVTHAQAKEALVAQKAAWQSWLATREAFLPPGFIDEQALYSQNLVSGMLLAET